MLQTNGGNKMAKFSIGYNGDKIDTFKGIIKPYINEIESIFFSIPTLAHSHHNINLKYVNENNNIDFIKSDFGVKKILAINNLDNYFLNNDFEQHIMYAIIPFIKNYHIDGVILTNLKLAQMLRQEIPNIELHTSCNCYIYTTQEMKRWKELAGIDVFNPPRDILKLPNLLKQMHDEGFKLKCLVNEACLIGCPQSLAHQALMSITSAYPNTFKQGKVMQKCHLNDYKNFFKACWVLPRWLNKLEPYVDIFKITSRHVPSEILSYMLDCYINRRDDVDILPALASGPAQSLKCLYDIKIPTQIIPDKLLTCEMKECDKTCFICRELYEKLKMDNLKRKKNIDKFLA